MPNKLQMITELSKETTKEVTKSPEKWLKFLDSASNNYKYPFNDQILIYAQRPDARVCADMDTWNKRLHRWIKKGSKGIALLQNKNGYLSLKHIFDIADTYDNFGSAFNVWTIPNNSEQQVIESLENSFGALEFKDNLEDAIVSSVRNSVEDNIQDYLTDFKSILEGSLLEEHDDFNLDYNFKKLMINSISYMMLKRCGYDPMDYFDIDDFNKIIEFNTIETISRFGIAMSDIAEVELHEIYTTVLDIQKNKNHTFVQNQITNYDVNNNINESEVYNERSNDDGSKISQRGGLYDTQPNNGATGEHTTGQMGENENEIHSREPERSIYGANDERNTNEIPSRDRPNSNNENRADSETVSPREQSERGNESEQPTTMGWTDEQLQESSRGDSSTGINIQLNLFEDNKTEEEQINLINTLAEVNDTPAFFNNSKQQETPYFEIDKNFRIDANNYIHIHNSDEGFFYDLIDENGEIVDGGLLEYDEEYGSVTNEKMLLNKLSDFTGIDELKTELEEVSDEFIDSLQDKDKTKENRILENIPQEKINYHIDNNLLGEGTPKEKFRRNIEAIKVIQKCEEENRLATKEEQKILAQYVGWGGLSDAFDNRKDNWHTEYEELKELLTEEEYSAVRASTLTAFYTPPVVIKSMYKALQNMGLERGNILEPSCRSWKLYRNATTRIK